VGSLVGRVGWTRRGEVGSGSWVGGVVGDWALGLLGVVVWVMFSMEIWVGREVSIGSHVVR
jgi:hypothetical protein